MCGIFGIITKDKSKFKPDLIKSTASRLFKLSESRGKESSGLALLAGDKIKVFKQPVPASTLIKSIQYKNIFNETFNGSSSNRNKRLVILGHTRLVTDGDLQTNQNNQPVIKSGVVGVHNGIVVNHNELWQEFPSLERKYQVDTEIILDLVRIFTKETKSLKKAIQKTFELIKGSASIALLFDNIGQLVLATNTGSLYFYKDRGNKFHLFASEKYILRKILRNSEIVQVKPRTGYLIDLNSLRFEKFNFDSGETTDFGRTKNNLFNLFKLNIVDLSPHRKKAKEKKFAVGSTSLTLRFPQKVLAAINSLRRCVRCILPETMPFIEFDERGVCNYCRNYRKIETKGQDELERVVSPYRNRDGRADCLVAFSGGRDSSYGLHYIKNVLRMNPIAYSYDWGMLTDLARRNQARISGQLGIEHILIPADIRKKRENIRKNVLAWLKRPDLGTVPLFMAGDKQYFYFANQLRKKLGLKLVIYCENSLERTYFKVGFCRIKPTFINERHTLALSLIGKLKLAFYYTKQLMANPAYFNSSLLDSLGGYFASYFIPHNYLFLYEYVKWDEGKIIQTLISQYDWEMAVDTKNTWRIGDGTAAFYNYIYYLGAGFTENDTFRSNQIREGLIERDKALELVKKENQPRYQSIKWYCQTIGLDFNQTIKAINSMPRLY